MAATPRVSIALPVYNGANYLAGALESLSKQTFADYELILADNASSDETEEIARRYAAQDPRVRYLRSDTNRGGTWNFNRVVDEARGTYFKWAAHDDLCLPRFVEVCVRELDADPNAVLCYPQATIIDGDGHVMRDYSDDLDLRDADPVVRFRRFLDVYRRPHRGNPLFGVHRTAVLRQTPLLGKYVSADILLLGELALRGEIHELPERLFLRRDHEQASVRATPSFRARIAWFDPALVGTLQMTRWIWLRAYRSAVRRASLSPDQRRSCYALLRRWMLWNARGLAKDAAKAAIWPLVRATRRA